MAQAKRAAEDMLERVRRAQSSSAVNLALLRRKQGFESPRERGVSKKPSIILDN